MSKTNPGPLKHHGKEMLPLSDDERIELLARQENAREMVGLGNRADTIYDDLLRLEATIRAREDDLRAQHTRLEVEAAYIEQYAEAETTFDLCQQLAHRLRTCVTIGPRAPGKPGVTLTDDQVAALVTWADEGDRKGGTTGFGAYFTVAMEVARAVRAMSQKAESV